VIEVSAFLISLGRMFFSSRSSESVPKRFLNGTKRGLREVQQRVSGVGSGVGVGGDVAFGMVKEVIGIDILLDPRE